MYCASCFQDNPDDVASCVSCGSPMLPPMPSGLPEPPPRPATPPEPPPRAAVSGVVESAPTTEAAPGERRSHERLDIHVNMVLRYLDADGLPTGEEQTIADNISRGGARVMTGRPLSPGAIVEIAELGGDFTTRAVVRGRWNGNDRIPRLNLQFLDRPAPARLGGSEDPWSPPVVEPPPASFEPPTPEPDPSELTDATAGEAEPPREQEPLSPPPAPPPLPTSEPPPEVVSASPETAPPETEPPPVPPPLPEAPPPPEATPDPKPVPPPIPETARAPKPVPPPIPEAALHPESTDPPAVSTAPADAAPEAESDLPPETAALRDEILKLHQGLKARSFYELLDVPKKATVREISAAYGKLARKYHPDRIAQVGLPALKEPANAIFIRLGEAKDTLSDSEERAWYDRKLASGALTPATGTPQAGGEAKAGGIALGWNAANDVIAQARSLLKDEKYWDVIQNMEAAIPLVPDEPQRRTMQVLLAKATLKNPKWVRRAEEQLRRVVSEDPKQVEALLALGQIYRDGGLRARATRMYSRVLEVERRNEEAKAALAELEAQG